MTDQTTSGAAPGGVCPWCSAALPDPGVAKCPSCGAALVGTVDESLPGLTTIDAGAIVRAKQTAIRPKSRLLSWLSGDDGDEVFTKAEGNALEPPDLEVRREILRLELEAEVANLQAENEAIMAEAVAEGRVVEVPPELAEAAEAAGIELPATPEGGEDAEPSSAAEIEPVAEVPAAAEPAEPASAAEDGADAPATEAPADAAAADEPPARRKGRGRGATD
jgi:hypothetical protein